MTKGDYVVGTLTAAPGAKASGYLDVPGTTVRMPLEIFAKCGHGPHTENTPKFVAVVREFLAHAP